MTHQIERTHNTSKPAQCSAQQLSSKVRRSQKNSQTRKTVNLLGRRGVFGDSFCALRHGMLRELTGQDEPHTGGTGQFQKQLTIVARMTHEVWISRDEMVDFLL